jgi:hypothetical protein
MCTLASFALDVNGIAIKETHGFHGIWRHAHYGMTIVVIIILNHSHGIP